MTTAASALAWSNFTALLVSTLLTLVFYVKSAGPVALEKQIGPTAYARCTGYRFLAGVSMGIVSINWRSWT